MANIRPIQACLVTPTNPLQTSHFGSLASQHSSSGECPHRESATVVAMPRGGLKRGQFRDQPHPPAELQHRARRSVFFRGRAITADPQAIAGNIAGTIVAGAVQTASPRPTVSETAIRHQYRTLETLTCDKVLIVTPIQTSGCPGQFLTCVYPPTPVPPASTTWPSTSAAGPTA